MKKLFAIAALVALFAVSAWAQPGNNNQDQGQQEFKIYVICPIQVNPDNGTVDLGTIIPGQIKSFSSNNFAEFTVTGHSGESFTTSASLTIWGIFDGNNPTGWVKITQSKWQERDGNANWNDYTIGNPLQLIGGGNSYDDCTAERKLRCVVEQVQASNNAKQGTWKFPVTLTATYVGV